MRDRPRVLRLDQLAFELSRHIADEIDFDLRILDQQACRPNGRTRGRDLEIFLPHLVEGMEVAQVLQKHLRLDNMIERTSRGLEGAREILHDVMRALLDVRAVERKVRVFLGLSRNAGLEIGRQLAGREDQAANVKGLGVDRQRLRIVRLDDPGLHLSTPRKSLRLVLNRNIAPVGLLAVDDLNDMGQQQRIALFVELERAADAFEADFAQRVANGRRSRCRHFRPPAWPSWSRHKLRRYKQSG